MSQRFTFSCILIFYIPVRNALFDKSKEILNNLHELSDQNSTEMLFFFFLQILQIYIVQTNIDTVKIKNRLKRYKL